MFSVWLTGEECRHGTRPSRSDFLPLADALADKLPLPQSTQANERGVGDEARGGTVTQGSTSRLAFLLPFGAAAPFSRPFPFLFLLSSTVSCRLGAFAFLFGRRLLRDFIR